MSYIIAYADTERIVIAGDGRETDRNGKIINDETRRIEKLGGSGGAVIAGYVGHPGFCAQAILDARTFMQSRERGSKPYTVPEFSRHLKTAARSRYRAEYGVCSFVLGGHNGYGNPVLFALSSETGFSAVRNMPEPYSAKIICLCPYDSTIAADEILSYYLEGILPRKEAYRFAFAGTLREVAERDPRVGGRTTMEYIGELSD